MAYMYGKDCDSEWSKEKWLKWNWISNIMEKIVEVFNIKTLPEIRQGRTFIPMMDLVEAFGLTDITWDSKGKTAVFYF